MEHIISKAENSEESAERLGLGSAISNSGNGWGVPPVTGVTVNGFGDFTLDTNVGQERYFAVF